MFEALFINKKKTVGDNEKEAIKACVINMQMASIYKHSITEMSNWLPATALFTVSFPRLHHNII